MEDKPSEYKFQVQRLTAQDFWLSAKSEEEAIAKVKARYPDAISFRATPPKMDGMAWKVEATFCQTYQQSIEAWNEESAWKKFEKKHEGEKLLPTKLLETKKLDYVPLDLIYDAYHSFGWANSGFFSEEQKKLIQKAKEEGDLEDIAISVSGNDRLVVSHKNKFYFWVDCS